MSGSGAADHPHLVDDVGLESLGRQLRKGERVAGVGVDGTQRRLAHRQVVGVAGEDPGVAALGDGQTTRWGRTWRMTRAMSRRSASDTITWPSG